MKLSKKGKRLISLSVYLIIFIIFSAIIMDVFGNIGNDTDYTIEIKENHSLDNIATALKDKKIVISKNIFKQYYKINSAKSVIVPGYILVNSKMSYQEITKAIDDPTSNSVRITIPEGFEVREIITKLTQNGLVDNKEIEEALKNYKYTLKNGTEINGEYLLSGYLFPDTYDFYKVISPTEIIDIFVKNFDKHWTEEYDKRAKELNMTMADVITLASIIEREARKEEDFPKVSSVFHNRLKQKKALESCATVQYILKERKPVLSNADTKIDSPFNTYKNVGLPPSPIASPGDLAIKSALYPEDTDKLYFFTDKNGDNRYSVTFDEHNKQIKKFGL